MEKYKAGKLSRLGGWEGWEAGKGWKWEVGMRKCGMKAEGGKVEEEVGRCGMRKDWAVRG